MSNPSVKVRIRLKEDLTYILLGNAFVIHYLRTRYLK